MAFLERLIREKRFSDICRIRNFAAKCGDFRLQKVPDQREKDSLAERCECELSIEN
jgi:hypothetical protein